MHIFAEIYSHFIELLRAPLNLRFSTGPQNLTSFYCDLEVNNRGFYRDEILKRTNAELENAHRDSHTYIQWLFPLRTPSRFNATAPLLDDATVRAFHNNLLLKENLLVSFCRMLRFYGLEMNEETTQITRAPNFEERFSIWLRWENHNFSRISRIIGSMKILGFPAYSEAFFVIMRDIRENEGRGIINDKNLDHWDKARNLT